MLLLGSLQVLPVTPIRLGPLLPLHKAVHRLLYLPAKVTVGEEQLGHLEQSVGGPYMTDHRRETLI